MPDTSIQVVSQALASYETVTLAPIGFDASAATAATRNFKRMALVTPSVNDLYCMPFITIEYRDNSGFDKFIAEGNLEATTGGLMLQQWGTQLIDATPGYPSTDPWVDYVMNIDGSIGLTQVKDVVVEQTNGPVTWTLTINSATLTLVPGTTVTQTSQAGVGTIKTAVNNFATVTIEIESAIGQVFDAAADVVIDVGGTVVTILATDVTAATSTTAKTTGTLSQTLQNQYKLETKAGYITWTMTVTTQTVTVTQGMTVTQTSQSGVGTIKTAINNAATTTLVIVSEIGQVFDDIEDLVIDAAASNLVIGKDTITNSASATTPQPTVTFSSANVGDTVTQGASTGTLATALDGEIKSFFINCATNVVFNGAANVVIGGVTIQPASEFTMSHSGATTKVHIKANEGQVFTTGVNLILDPTGVPLTIPHAKITGSSNQVQNNCKPCDPNDPNINACESQRRYNCEDWKQMLLVAGSSWYDPKSGLSIHTVTRDAVTNTMSFKVDWNAPMNCERKAPFVKKWMRGHFYDILLSKGIEYQANDIVSLLNTDGVAASAAQVAAAGMGEDLYGIVPAAYQGGDYGVNVVATFATYTRFYHDERWPIQFSIGIQESKNMDEMTCAPVQMSYRLLGIFSEATNEPVCGWQFEEAGLERAACGQGLGGAVLNLGIPPNTPAGAYRVFVRGFHWNENQKVKPYDAWHSVTTDNEETIEQFDPTFKYRRQSYDEVTSNSWEYIICVDEYNQWSQEIGSAGCGDPTTNSKRDVRAQKWTDTALNANTEWKLTIDNQELTTMEGMTVTQTSSDGVVSVGTIKLSNSGNTNTILIRSAVGQVFDTTAALIIDAAGTPITIGHLKISAASSFTTPNHLEKVQQKPCTTLDNLLNPRVPPGFSPQAGETKYAVNFNSATNQRASITHKSVALVTRFQAAAGGYLTPPVQRCNIYAAGTGGTGANDPAAPTVAQVLGVTAATCGGCVIDPTAQSKPFISIAHHADTPVNVFDNDYPGLLRVIFPKVLTPATSYVSYCAQEGNPGMGRETFTTLPLPTATPIVITNITPDTFDLTVTFNTKNPVVCDMALMNKPDNYYGNKMTGVDLNMLKTAEVYNSAYVKPGVSITLTIPYATYDFVVPGGKYLVYCAQGAGRNGAAAGEGYVNSDGIHHGFEDITNGNWDDVVVFDPVEFSIPAPPPCSRTPATVDTDQGDFRMENWRGIGTQQHEFWSETEADRFETTFPINNYDRVDMYRNSFVNHDSFACQNSNTNYKLQVLAVRSDVAAGEESQVLGNQDVAGAVYNASDTGADDQYTNYDSPDELGFTTCIPSDTVQITSDCKCASSGMANECLTGSYCWADLTCHNAAKPPPNGGRRQLNAATADWKVETTYGGRGSVMVGIPNTAGPGLYRLWLRTIHEIGNRCIDYDQTNQIELFICVCANTDLDCIAANKASGINGRQLSQNPESTTADQIWNSLNQKWELPAADLGKMKYYPGTYTEYNQFKCGGSAAVPQVLDIPSTNTMETHGFLAIAPNCPMCEICDWNEECCLTCGPYNASLANAGDPRFGVCGSCQLGSTLDPLTHQCKLTPIQPATAVNEYNEWIENEELQQEQEEAALIQQQNTETLHNFNLTTMPGMIDQTQPPVDLSSVYQDSGVSFDGLNEFSNTNLLSTDGMVAAAVTNAILTANGGATLPECACENPGNKPFGTGPGSNGIIQKPWSDWESCEAEISACGSNEMVRALCPGTCCVCEIVPASTENIPPIEVVHQNTITTPAANGGTTVTITQTTTTEGQSLAGTPDMNEGSEATEIDMTVSEGLYTSAVDFGSSSAGAVATQQVTQIAEDGTKLFDLVVELDADGNIAAAPQVITVYNEWTNYVSDADLLLIDSAAFSMDCGVDTCGGSSCDVSPAATAEQHIATSAAAASEMTSYVQTSDDSDATGGGAGDTNAGAGGNGDAGGDPFCGGVAAADCFSGYSTTPPVTATQCGATFDTLIAQGTASGCECVNTHELPGNTDWLYGFTTCQKHAEESFQSGTMFNLCINDDEFSQGCARFCGQCGADYDSTDIAPFTDAIENTEVYTAEMLDSTVAANSAGDYSTAAGGDGGIYYPVELSATEIAAAVTSAAATSSTSDSTQQTSYTEGAGLMEDGTMYSQQSDTFGAELVPCINWAGNIFGFEYQLEMGGCWPSVNEQCVNAYEIADSQPHSLPKPWDDFVSCENEKEECGSNPSLPIGCKATCGLCEQAPSFQLCIGSPGSPTTSEIAIDGILLRFTYQHSCFKMYPDGSQGGHLEFAAEAKLLPCENPLADNCLQRLCHQSTLTANSGNSNPICDGGDDGWVPLQHSAVPRFGQSGNSMSSSSTPGNVMVDQSKTYFELDFQGEMQPASSMYPFMYFGSTRRCYLQWNTTATGLPYLLPPDCVLTHQYADFPQGSSFTSELTNTGMPTMNDFNDYGSLSPPSQCQGTCCDSYMTGALAKPWDDFLSCEAEKVSEMTDSKKELLFFIQSLSTKTKRSTSFKWS